VAVGAATSPPTPYNSWKKCCNGTCTEVGCEAGFFVGPLLPWAQPIGAAQELLPDGVEAMADVIRQSGDQGVDVLSIGPFTDLAALSVRHPELAARCRVFAMAGSVDTGYDGDYGPDAEYNVITDIPAAQVVFSFKWASFALAPVDTTRALQLQGLPWAGVHEAAARLAPGASVVMEQHRVWLRTCQSPGSYWCSANGQHDPAYNASSIIFDAQAAFMLVMGGQRELEIEEVRLTVNASGFTVRASDGLPVNVSLKWRPSGEDTFYGCLVSRLSSTPAPPTPAACTAESNDPWSTGHEVGCCDGLQEVLKNWDGDGRWYYKCKGPAMPTAPMQGDVAGWDGEVFV